MTELPEDRVFSRHDRVRGAALVLGAGAVGGGTAIELAYMGLDRMWICDYKRVQDHNVGRQVHSAEDIGKNKAEALAQRIRRERSWCDAVAIPENFLSLPEDLQIVYARAAGLVVAATDVQETQRRINRICLRAEVPAVYPGVWVDPRVHDAEVGEVLWVLPGRHTPCYQCAFIQHGHAPDADAARGSRLNIQQTVLATAQVVKALLNPEDADAAILDAGDADHGVPSRNLIWLHGFTPTSPAVRAAFPNVNGLFSRNMEVHFPPTPCPACGGHEETTTAPPPPPPRARTPAHAQHQQVRAALAQARIDDRIGQWLTAAVLVLLGLIPIALVTLLIVLTVKLASPHPQAVSPGAATSAAPTSPPHPASPASTPAAVAPTATAPPRSATLPTPAPSQTPAAINYSSIGLECYSTCSVINVQDTGSPANLGLEVTNISSATLVRLCSEGDTIQWSDNYRDLTSLNLGWICGQQLVDIDIQNVATIHIYSPVNNSGLPIDGPWKITFRLVGPSGQILASANYQTTVVGCTAPSGGC